LIFEFFFENPSRKYNFDEILTIKTGTLHENLRMYNFDEILKIKTGTLHENLRMFLIISRRILLFFGVTNVPDKICS